MNSEPLDFWSNQPDPERRKWHFGIHFTQGAQDTLKKILFATGAGELEGKACFHLDVYLREDTGQLWSQ